MSKICAKCSKAVYPLEELKCLDKIWHKGCFRCWECNMTLNMKNYKGYDKKPYCSAHYPQTKATVVADTPELQRLARNTELQSQVKYHEEFEKKIKGSKIQVTDDPETQRLKHLNSVVSQVEYKGMREKTGRTESRRQSLPPTSEKKSRWPVVNNSVQSDGPVSPFSDRSTSTSIMYMSDGKVEAPRQKRIGSIADYDPVNENYGSLTQGYNPVSRMSQSQEWEETIPVSPSATLSTCDLKKNQEKEIPKVTEVHALEPAAEASTEDKIIKDKETDNEEVFPNEDHLGGSPAKLDVEGVASHVEIQKVETEGLNAEEGEMVDKDKETRQILDQSEEELNCGLMGKIDDKRLSDGNDKTVLLASGDSLTKDVEAEEQSSTVSSSVLGTMHEQVLALASDTAAEKNEVKTNSDEVEDGEAEDTDAKETDAREENQQPQQDTIVTESKPLSGTFVALYDYEAQDDDEVGFSEGDQVVSCESVDDGWMIGTVARTGERGMLPSNYVERVI